MAGYAKVFDSLLTSSLWVKDHHVLRIWIAMLARCDANGVVEGSIPGFASLCRVTDKEMEDALDILTGPDPYSRTPDHEGRRLEVIPGGWKILNYKAYRAKGQEKEGSKAPFMRTLRERRKEGNALPVEVTRYPTATANAVQEENVRRIEGPKAPPSPAAPAAPTRRVKRLKTTDLKPGSVDAFQAAWEAIPKTVTRWNQGQRRDLEEPVAKGSRAQAERRFQELVDQGIARPRTLYVAFWAYLNEGDGPKRGYIQHMASFFGPEKATWREWLERAREIELEKFGEVS